MKAIILDTRRWIDEFKRFDEMEKHLEGARTVSIQMPRPTGTPPSDPAKDNPDGPTRTSAQIVTKNTKVRAVCASVPFTGKA
jgi:hypothetical protein